jgi:methylmalonyl-CoA/ethylmalonyl-CoA epimerase
MNERTLDHVGIAVASLEDALTVWTSILKAPGYGHERVESQSVEVVFVGTGAGRIELLAPTSSASPVARFLEKRGPGLHHVCYRVPDLEAALAEHAEQGFELIDRIPRRGAHDHLVAFLHPRTSGGVLVELLQEAEQ